MNKILKIGGIFTGIFAISFGGAFIAQYKKPKQFNYASPNEEVTPIIHPLSEQQRVLNSLLDIKAFTLDGGMTMISKDNTKIGFTFGGKGDLTDLDDIKLNGDIDVNLNDSHLKANFSYFDNELFFDYHESYFKLETEKLLDFVKLLPVNYDIGVEIPSEIEEMDLDAIESYFEDMSEKELTPDGQNYYFTIKLSDDISIYIVTDLDLNFAGIRTGTIDYQGMLFSLEANLHSVSHVDLINPKNTADYEKYQDFSPAFKLFDGIYALTKKRQNTVNIELDVRKYKDDVKSNLLRTNLDITYDLLSIDPTFALDGKVITERQDKDGHDAINETLYNFALYQKSIYAHYGDVAISVELDSVTALLQYVINKIGDAKVEGLVSSLISTMSASQITDLVAKADNLLGTIVLTNDELGINLNTSNFSTTTTNILTGETEDKLKLTDMYVAIKFDSNSGALQSLEIKNFGLNNYEADLVVTFGEYKPFTVNKSDYQKIDHLIGIAEFYDIYKDLNKFRIEFDAKVSKDDEIVSGNTVSYNDILVDGGLQFELDPLRGQEGHTNIGYGYGDLSVLDRKNVKHTIRADMKNVDEILLSYSTKIGNTKRDAEVDPMNVKMRVQTMKDLVEVITTLVKDPDEHFNELFGALLDKTASMPIGQIIAGDYLQLLTTNLVDRFEVGDDYIEMDVSLDILAFENSAFKLRIDFTSDEYGISGLKDLKVSNFSFEGLHVDFNAYLKEFDDSLESSRLSPAEDYIDFSDLKVLLQLGINTSKNNYYHFTATAKVTISLFNISLDLPLDIKVWTDHGDVKVSVDMTDIPTIIFVNVPTDRALTTKNRTAHIYYHDKAFYVNRSETYTEGLIRKKTYLVEHVAKYNVDQFLENAIEILCGDVLCLSDSIMEKINESVNKGNDEAYQMKYENILNYFIYSASGHYFYFDINLAELANNEQLETLTVKVLTDNSNTSLTGLNANLTVKLTSVLSLVVSLNLTLADCSPIADSSNNLTALDAYEARLSDKEFGYKLTNETQI